MPSKPQEAQPPMANKPISPEPVLTPTPYSPPQVEQPQIPAIPPGELPSRVDETLGDCPKFRIVLVGKSGVGKSSLIRSMFNIDPDDKTKIDISHDSPGEADIKREYTSPANPRFILHDSKGFEAGSGGNWDTVKDFLRDRRDLELPGRIHAIWFCVETPRKGGRLLQTGDEKLLQLAKEFDIPIIAVFTKYDQLVTQFSRKDKEKAEDAALKSFNDSVMELQKAWVKLSTDPSIPCIKVSTKTSKNAQQMLIDLTDETHSRLHDIEDKLRVLWAAAQQVNPRQKVEVSISEGSKKYWKDLGKSTAFEGQILIDCVHRIHDDVLKVWNLSDTTKILSGTDFFTQMIDLVKPLIDEQVNHSSRVPPVLDFGSKNDTVLRPLLEKFAFEPLAIHYLYSKYQKYPSTAKLLATYIINLMLILHDIFTELRSSDLLVRALSTEIVGSAVKLYKDRTSALVIKELASNDIDFANPEQVIRSVILGLLPQPA